MDYNNFSYKFMSIVNLIIKRITPQVFAVEEGGSEPVYSVELINDSFFPPLELGKELACMGLSEMDQVVACMEE